MYNFYLKIKDERFNYIGSVYEYFYAGGFVPSVKTSCNDLLEQLQFLHEIYLELTNNKFFNLSVPQEAVIILQSLFDGKEAYDLTHWSLFQFEIFDKIKNENCIYDLSLNEFVFKNDNYSLHIPYSFEYLIEQSSVEDIGTRIRDKQLDLSQVEFGFNEETLKSSLFMSETQLLKNKKVINELMTPIYLLLSDYGYEVNNCSDLTLLLNSNIQDE